MVVIDDTSLATDLTKYLEPLWSPEAAWVVAKRQQPIALAQLDAIGSTIHSTISEIIGINIWPLTNVACFELIEGKQNHFLPIIPIFTSTIAQSLLFREFLSLIKDVFCSIYCSR
jgi:hypothetical protein